MKLSLLRLSVIAAVLTAPLASGFVVTPSSSRRPPHQNAPLFRLAASTTDAAVSSSSEPSTTKTKTTNKSSNADDSFADTALTIAAAASTLAGQTVVVKYGGNAMTSEELKGMFCQDVAALQNLGVRVVVVHGGGPQINQMLERVGVESRV